MTLRIILLLVMEKPVLNTEQMVVLKLRGEKEAEIARHFKTSRQVVHKRTSKYIKNLQKYVDPKALEEYRQRRIDLYDTTEYVLLDKILDGKKIKRANLTACAYALEKIHTIKRLENNQSTMNINIVHNTAKLIKEYNQELDQIEKQLNKL